MSDYYNMLNSPEIVICLSDEDMYEVVLTRQNNITSFAYIDDSIVVGSLWMNQDVPLMQQGGPYRSALIFAWFEKNKHFSLTSSQILN